MPEGFPAEAFRQRDGRGSRFFVPIFFARVLRAKFFIGRTSLGRTPIPEKMQNR